jgi:DNA-directed RNA polymerase specialized sigma24 family protein
LEVEQTWNDVWEQEKFQRGLERVRQQYKGSRTFLAFEMTAVQGKSVEAVAEELGLSADSVYKSKTRVTAALKEAIQSLADELE